MLTDQTDPPPNQPSWGLILKLFIESNKPEQSNVNFFVFTVVLLYFHSLKILNQLFCCFIYSFQHFFLGDKLELIKNVLSKRLKTLNKVLKLLKI